MTKDDEDYGLKPELRGKTQKWYVSRGQDGFTLVAVAQDRFRTLIDSASDRICAITGHHYCMIYGKVNDWAEKKSVILARFPIERAQAEQLSFYKNTWSYLDEDEDEEEKEDN